MKELAEIDKNIQRVDIHYLDRGNWLKRRKEIYEQLYPEAKEDKVDETVLPIFTEDKNFLIKNIT